MENKKINRTLNLISKIIYYLILVILITLTLLLFFSKFNLPGNFKVLVVKSGSMEPTLQTGALIIVKPVKNYQVNDIITFKKTNAPDNTITHRLIEIKTTNNKQNFITKGDANEDQDVDEVYPSRVVGKVFLNIPYLGYAVAAAKTKYGFLLIIVIPALLIIADEIKKIIQEAKKIKNKTQE